MGSSSVAAIKYSQAYRIVNELKFRLVLQFSRIRTSGLFQNTITFQAIRAYDRITIGISEFRLICVLYWWRCSNDNDKLISEAASKNLGWEFEPNLDLNYFCRRWLTRGFIISYIFGHSNSPFGQTRLLSCGYNRKFLCG